MEGDIRRLESYMQELPQRCGLVGYGSGDNRLGVCPVELYGSARVSRQASFLSEL